MNCAAVICAAGAGSRMGKNKALCLLEQQTFLSSIVHTLQASSFLVSPIVIVTGSQSELVMDTHKHLSGISWVHNPDWEHTHMLESLTCGIQSVPSGFCVLHWPVDCIGIPPHDVDKLIQAPEHPLAVLSFNGKSGHPMRILSPVVDLMRSGNHSFKSLKELCSAYNRFCVEASESALTNCNTPENLADFVEKSRHL